MKIIFLLILNILLIRLQLSFFSNLIFLEIPLVISLWYILEPDNKPSYGIFFATFIGLISDYLFGYPLGLYGFSLTITCYIIYHIYKKLYIQSRIFLIFIFILAHLLNSSIFFILLKIFHIQILKDFFFSLIISSLLGSVILTFSIKRK